MVLVVKNTLANAGDKRDLGSIPGSGRSPGGGHGNPLQYSCLENSMDRRAWWAMVHGVTNSWTWLKQLSMQSIPFNATDDMVRGQTMEIQWLLSLSTLRGTSTHLKLWTSSPKSVHFLMQLWVSLLMRSAPKHSRIQTRNTCFSHTIPQVFKFLSHSEYV